MPTRFLKNFYSGSVIQDPRSKGSINIGRGILGTFYASGWGPRDYEMGEPPGVYGCLFVGKDFYQNYLGSASGWGSGFKGLYLTGSQF